jgi:hypothetical protein
VVWNVISNIKPKPMKKFSIILIALLGIAAGSKEYYHSEVNPIMVHDQLSSAPAYRVGERLEYRVHYGWLDAGVASIEVKRAQNAPVSKKGLLHMVGIGKTTGAFDWFYKVRDRYETYIDPKSGLPEAFVRRVNEGGFIINRDYFFDHENNHVKTNKGEFETPTNVQDLLSSFYYLRSIDMKKAKPGDVFQANAFMDYEIYPFQVKFLGIEKVKVDAGEFKCYKFVPVVQKGRVFKDEEDLKVWITCDQNKIPVLAQAEVLVGSIKMELTDYKGLGAPVASL